MPEMVEDMDERLVYMDELGKFDLSQMWHTFEIASFERQEYRAHLRGIMSAVTKRRLIDFIITVYKLKGDKKWRVIDGQHRLNALYHLFKEGKLKSYPLTLRVINAKSEKEAREIYLSMNAGKPLIGNDILKAYDTGNVYFFKELGNVCTHHSGSPKISYLNCLSALCYVKKGNASLRKPHIESFLNTILNWEVVRMKELIQTMYIITDNDAKNLIFSANVFRPLSRLYFEDFKNAIGKKWENFIGNLENDQTIRANRGKWTTESCNMIYEYMKNKWEKVK